MPSKCLKELNELLENKFLKFTDQISNKFCRLFGTLTYTAQFNRLQYTYVLLAERLLSISLGHFLSCDYTCRSLLSNMLVQFLAGMLGSTRSKFYDLRVLGSSEKCVLHIINYS